MINRPARNQLLRPVSRGDEITARVVITVYALAALASLLLVIPRLGKPLGPTTWVEQLFTTLNVPLASNPVSVVILWILWGALLRRKRVALIAVVALQILSGLISLAILIIILLDPEQYPTDHRYLIFAILDFTQLVLASIIGLVSPYFLWKARGAFPARVRSTSLARGLLVMALGLIFTLALSAAAVFFANIKNVDNSHLFISGLARALGFSDPFKTLSKDPRVFLLVLSNIMSVLIAVSVCLGIYIWLRPTKRKPSPADTKDEILARQLLENYPSSDSLAYFSTRRDKKFFISEDRRAALSYRQIGPVCLVSSDPIGDPALWPRLVSDWMVSCRSNGWMPAVLSASEEGARVYAHAGLSVISYGDEAILKPDTFSLNNLSMTDVRHAVQRARRGGIQTGIHRIGDLPFAQRQALETTVRNWRTGKERGFSMALGRFNDPSDDDSTVVVAHDSEGAPYGLLVFVPWGRSGLSLDLMLRHPQAPNGTTELMIADLMQYARSHGIRQVSLNFAVFRGIFADADRLGAGYMSRLNSGVLGVLDRFTQVESLYRANAKFHPQWQPRYILFDGLFSLPQTAVAAAVAEGFLPSLPWDSPRYRPPLCSEDLASLQARRQLSDSSDVSDLVGYSNAYTRLRLAQADRLESLGVPAYPTGSQDALPLAALDPETLASSGTVKTYGRVRHLRKHGGVLFVDLVDGSRNLQLIFDRSSTSNFEASRRGIGVGDILLVEGSSGKSRNGTSSLLVTSWSMGAKTLHPVPFRGLEDPEARLRRRSTELATNPEQIERLKLRSRAVQGMREILLQEGYTEVETPMLNTVHGGASARPFKTFINAYGVDLTLRIAPELQLKRLLVGGLGAVFEIGRNFRNEGADATHNPEFTALEAYQPYGDYTTMRELTERLIKNAAIKAHGTCVLPLREPGEKEGRLVDVSGPWPVIRVVDAVSDYVGQRVDINTNFETLLALCRKHKVDVRPDMGPGALIEELYGELVEPQTSFPTFYTDFPVESSPLAGPHRSDPGYAERWDLVANGMELGTAYSELTDPVEQRRRLTEQSLKAAHGDPEAMAIDEDFLYSLETGMPPAGGLGLGVDRIVMLLTDTSIRDVITFPFVRPLN